MGEPLKRMHGQQDQLLSSSKSAKKNKLANQRSQSDTRDTAVSDTEPLLGTGNDIEEGELTDDDSLTPLCEELEHFLNEGEKTDVPVPAKLANIAKKFWLQKLGDEQLKEKLDKYH